jgi:hypothetical protein
MNQNQGAPDMSAMAMQYWAEMARFWMGTMAPFMPPGMAGSMRQAERAWERGWGSPERERHERTAFAVEIASKLPADVVVDLAGCHTHHLRALELRSIEHPDRAPIKDVHVGHHDHHLRVRITVPDDQPAGVYVGMIVDRESGDPRGGIRLTLKAAT